MLEAMFDGLCWFMDDTAWYVKVLAVLVYYALVFLSCALSDHFNPYLK